MRPDSRLDPAAIASLTSSAPAGAPWHVQLATGIGIYLLFALTYAVFAPGFSGYFLFDDFPNLSALDTIKNDPTTDQIIQFFLHGIASPTGRPLTLATFAVQAFDWAGNPAAFMRVNLLFHLLNGALLFWWLHYLLRLMGLPARRTLVIPLLTLALWLVAPIQVTAVIYVVQRMTELSATFVFLGILLYLAGRDYARIGRHRLAMTLMTLGLALGVGLGVLAKENAVLLPLLIVILEFTLLAGIPRPPHWRAWAALMLAAPLLLLLGVLAMKSGHFFSSYAVRDFSLVERLMTEARILFMYLYKMVLPWPSAIRLLYDDFPVSRSLFQPWTTLPSVAGVLFLLGGALWARARSPVLAFAVLWFLGSHVLESTVIPLELVFDHRNYQASVSIYLAIALGVAFLWERASSRQVQAALVTLVVAYVALTASVTLQVTTLWGRPLQMAAWWEHKLPDSKRAKIEFLGTLLAFKLTDQVVQVANRASERWPDDPAFQLVLMHFSCHHAEIEPPPVDDIAQRVRVTRSDIFTVFYLLDTITGLVERDLCRRVEPATLRRLLDAAFDNPVLLTQRRNLLLLYARVLKVQGETLESLRYFRQAVDVTPLMILLFQGALDELEAGRLEQAHEYLRMAESDPRVSAVDRWSHRKDIEAMRELLELYATPQPVD